MASSRSRSRAARMPSRNRVRAASSRCSAGKSVRSAPAQKLPPAPDSKSSRADDRPTSSTSRASSCQPAAGMALRAAGRSSTSRATSPSQSRRNMRPCCRAVRALSRQKKGRVARYAAARPNGSAAPVRWRAGTAGECRRAHNRASTRHALPQQEPCHNEILRFPMVNGGARLCRDGIRGSAQPSLAHPPVGTGRRDRGRGGVSFGG